MERILGHGVLLTDSRDRLWGGRLSEDDEAGLAEGGPSRGQQM
jgi:hypothetical protein